jgi:hypothetical protein
MICWTVKYLTIYWRIMFPIVIPCRSKEWTVIQKNSLHASDSISRYKTLSCIGQCVIMPKIQCKFSIKVVHSTLIGSKIRSLLFCSFCTLIGSKFSIIVVLFILHTDWIEVFDHCCFVHSALIGSKFSIIVVLFILHTDWIEVFDHCCFVHSAHWLDRSFRSFLFCSFYTDWIEVFDHCCFVHSAHWLDRSFRSLLFCSFCTDWIGFRIMCSITRMNDNINMDMPIAGWMNTIQLTSS